MRRLMLLLVLASASVCTAAHAAAAMPTMADLLAAAGQQHPQASASLQQLEQQLMGQMTTEQRRVLEWAKMASAEGMTAFGNSSSSMAGNQRRLHQDVDEWTTAPAGTTSVPTLSATMEGM